MVSCRCRRTVNPLRRMSAWRKKSSHVDANNHAYEMESNNYGNSTSDPQNGNVVRDNAREVNGSVNRASVQGMDEPSYESLEDKGLNKEVEVHARLPYYGSNYKVNDDQVTN